MHGIVAGSIYIVPQIWFYSCVSGEQNKGEGLKVSIQIQTFSF